MFNRKITRIVIGLVFLVFLIVSLVPSLYTSNSSDGIINARTTTMKSPIEGVVKFTRPTKCGMVFSKGELIGQVVNDRVSKAHLQELCTEKRTLERRVTALHERILEFNALNRHLDENISKYQKHAELQLKHQIRQTEDKLTQEKAEFGRSKKEYDANRQLIDRQALKMREYETSEASFTKSTARISELESHGEELKNSLTAVQSGVFLGDGHNDVPYSSQRRDQLVIETSLAKTALAEAQDRIIGIALQIDAEQQRLQKMECYRIVAPFDGLIWRMSATEASSVVIDSELVVLLDAGSIFLDFTVSEAQFSDIKPGEDVQYRLVGANAYHKAKVFALRGSGSNITDLNVAAAFSKDPKREFHIWAEVSKADLEFLPHHFYQVGRRAEVKISRKWHPIREITRFFNVF